MSTSERAARLIKRLARDQHSRYAQALVDSMTWDSENKVRPPSPDELSRWHSLPLDALEAQLVVLSKTNAVKLLADVGHPIGLPSLQRNILTEKSCVARLKRKGIRVKTRLVFTYTEVLFLAGFSGKISPPSEVKKLLG
jgi:hypothetical protein